MGNITLRQVAELLCEIREQSPDPETKVGAVLLTPVGHKVKATGYNTFPTPHEYPTTRPDKYSYMVHAEALIIASLGNDCLNHKVVVTHAPCTECIKLMITAGVSEIWFFNSHLSISEESFLMLRNAGVKVSHVRCRVEELREYKEVQIDRLLG